MKLKFKTIKGTKYTVRFKKPDGRTWGNDIDGVCYFPRGLLNEADIEVNPYRTDQTIFNTVIHEVTHAYFDKLTETEVTKFANTLSRLLFNNLQFKNYDVQQLIKD
jgi:ABC-type microcin C transport system permease subunit YejB